MPHPIRSRSTFRSSARRGTACAWLLVGLTAAVAGCNRDKTNPFSATRSSEPAPTLAPDPVDSAGTPMFEEGTAPPEVSLNGAASAAALPTVAGSSNRLAALSWQTAVHKLPDKDSQVLGYLRAGGVVSASTQPMGHKDCPDGWYRIAPFGYVCVSKTNATLDLEHELVRALSRRPDTSSSLPYMYGTVRRPGPIYARLPSREQAAAAEPGLEQLVRE